MSTGSIVFFALVAVFVVFAVVAQIRAWRRDRAVKGGEGRGGPVDLRRSAADQQTPETAAERLRNTSRNSGLF